MALAWNSRETLLGNDRSHFENWNSRELQVGSLSKSRNFQGKVIDFKPQLQYCNALSSSLQDDAKKALQYNNHTIGNKTAFAKNDLTLLLLLLQIMIQQPALLLIRLHVTCQNHLLAFESKIYFFQVVLLFNEVQSFNTSDCFLPTNLVRKTNVVISVGNRLVYLFLWSRMFVFIHTKLIHHLGVT